MEKKYSKKIKVPRFNEESGFYTTKERSKLMSKIKNKETKAEIILRKAIWGKGFRYRKNFKSLPGKPDIVFFKQKVAVFIDGEFWHGYDWVKKKKKIKSNPGFWIPKIERNIQRDTEVNEFFKKEGWLVIRLWEQTVKKNLSNCVEVIIKSLKERT